LEKRKKRKHYIPEILPGQTFATILCPQQKNRGLGEKGKKGRKRVKEIKKRKNPEEKESQEKES